MRRKRPRHFNKLLQILMVIMVFIGLGIALYPFYVNAANSFIDDFRLAHLTGINNQTADKMRKENARLAGVGMTAGKDPFSGSSKTERINIDKHLIGSVSIPKIKVNVPLFDKTTPLLLNYGATVVQGTSYPLGGKNTHTVISAHRGLASRKLFTDLNHVKKGNVFVLTVNHKKMAYKVYKIQVVKPTNTAVLKITVNQDLATLLTCTPYMINTDRLLVTGHRVPYTKGIAKQIKRANQQNIINQLLILVAIAILAISLLILLARLIHRYLLKGYSYDFIFKVVDQSNQPVAGVQYQLYNQNGKKKIFRHQEPYIVMTDKEGLAQFNDLPGGLYCMKAMNPIQNMSILFGTKKIKQLYMKSYPSRKTTEMNEDNGQWSVKI